MKVTYDTIGNNYNQTRKADPYLTDRLINYLKPKENGTYLDIGCGTGNYCIEIHKKGFQVIGIDPSKQMLEQARSKNGQIEWFLGSAENTGLHKNTIDGISAFLTIHHWTDLNAGFSELHKIVKPNGKIVIFTSTPMQMKGYWLNHYFPRMMVDSMAQMPTFEMVKQAMTKTGFEVLTTEVYHVLPDLQDQFLYCGKHNPELYFDTHVRHGISSFSALANKKEVDLGLSTLRKDIESGTIHDIIQSYENENGDYLYILGKKQCRFNK